VGGLRFDGQYVGSDGCLCGAGRAASIPDAQFAAAGRIGRAAPKLADPVAAWVRESKLPALQWRGGEPLSLQEVRYLLYRQSRAREIRPDIEVKPMFGLIDRAGSGAFAAAILQGFLASDADAGERWALTVAGLLGDDRLVPALSGQIREWVEKGRKGTLTTSPDGHDLVATGYGNVRTQKIRPWIGATYQYEGLKFRYQFEFLDKDQYRAPVEPNQKWRVFRSKASLEVSW